MIGRSTSIPTACMIICLYFRFDRLFACQISGLLTGLWLPFGRSMGGLGCLGSLGGAAVCSLLEVGTVNRGTPMESSAALT